MELKGEVTMVNTRGRVMRVHPWEVENLRRQGARLIINPREDYYPQYDQSLANSVTLTDYIVENVDPNDILEFEDV